MFSILYLMACAGGTSEEDVILGVKEVITADLVDLSAAATALRGAAPSGVWSGGAELDASKAAWRDARDAYERSEGAIAVLFPDLDHSLDQRYDGFITEEADDYLFDGEGVTGVHGVERVLWSDSVDPAVLAFESALTGYVPAAFPQTDGEAADYRDGLCQRFVDDAALLASEFEPLALDAAAAFEGVIGSMAEQVEKLTLGQTGEDESRYARYTLGDMRANLAGGRAVYEVFSPWVVDSGGEAVDAEVRAGFDRLAQAYDAIEGDALPEVPADWDADAPSDAALATPFGELWVVLQFESDPAQGGSLVSSMVEAASVVGISVVP
jgi:iron uptake system component EfeO